ncbi:hypothetical protein [Ectothiorhodospira shaposhnikovii]|uniref:hypothetical protein n=1 Tax=Ectothiorhodospira shaposhnikovii TaxID=1054 RepID=UPI001EE94D11|nr:hypothetical protein [Ectothiorhodospira shaposhnikovii]MCG5512338.1 hypothetical protein [Ectothiorhodospira shaposhnikovii]
MKISLIPTKTFELNDSSVREAENWVVWWYGPITKNVRDRTVPKVDVVFRILDPDGNLTQATRCRKTGLTHLGFLRIGSVWNKGVSHSQIRYEARTFDVSFSPGDWEIISPSRSADYKSGRPLIPAPECPQYLRSENNYIIRFKLPDGKVLFVPCMEFFIRCYGRSKEIQRVLTVYPWEEAKQRLYEADDLPKLEDAWPIRLGKHLTRHDAVFLAHLLYDPYAQKVARGIYNQLVSALNDADDYVFLKVAPWFQGPAKLKVYGTASNDGQTFKANCILGCSDPLGKLVLYEQVSKIRTQGDETSEGDYQEEISKPVVKIQRKFPEIINLTADDAPDHGSSLQEFLDHDFEVLGPPRPVKYVRKISKGSQGKYRAIEANDDVSSTGEPYGTGKGVGQALVQAPILLDSKGVLRDMWNAVCHLRDEWPDVFHSAEWFTFEDGFQDDPEPRLIALKPFDQKDEVSGATQKWVYYNLDTQTPRGALVIKVETSHKTVYILEIQRRPIRSKNDESDEKNKEEAFKGLVFVLDDPQALADWLRLFLAEIRLTRGIIMAQLTTACPGTALTFKHAPSIHDNVPCEAAVKNALGKAGVSW